jgi:hypothetical protein
MGRGWTILEAGNRGNVLMRSVGARVYGDLSEGVNERGDFSVEEYGPEQGPTANEGAGMTRSALSIGEQMRHLSRRDNGRSRRVR